MKKTQELTEIIGDSKIFKFVTSDGHYTFDKDQVLGYRYRESRNSSYGDYNQIILYFKNKEETVDISWYLKKDNAEKNSQHALKQLQKHFDE